MSNEIATQKPGESRLKTVLEYGPIIIFMIVYFVLRRSQPETAIYPAALILTILAVIALIISRLRLKKWPYMLVFTTVIVAGATGLAYFFHDPRFIYMKPTLINAAFAIGLLAGLVMGKNFLKLMMGGAFDLPAKAWSVLTLRWAVFFLAMAVLNECVWRNFSEPFWVKFKVMGFIPLMIIFSLAQMPFILKHGKLKGQDER